MAAEEQKMKKILFLFLLVLAVLVSCRTEYYADPEPVDLAPSVQLLFDSRPKDELFKVKEVKTFSDAVDNSATYLMAWQLWETYAISLEDYLKILRDASSK